jgi:hypothetical protein
LRATNWRPVRLRLDKTSSLCCHNHRK